MGGRYRSGLIEGEGGGPFSAPARLTCQFHPILPALFVATNAYLLYSSVAYTGLAAALGLVIVALGALFLIPPHVLKKKGQKP